MEIAINSTTNFSRNCVDAFKEKSDIKVYLNDFQFRATL